MRPLRAGDRVRLQRSAYVGANPILAPRIGYVGTVVEVLDFGLTVDDLLFGREGLDLMLLVELPDVGTVPLTSTDVSLTFDPVVPLGAGDTTNAARPEATPPTRLGASRGDGPGSTPNDGRWVA